MARDTPCSVLNARRSRPSIAQRGASRMVCFSRSAPVKTRSSGIPIAHESPMLSSMSFGFMPPCMTGRVSSSRSPDATRIEKLSEVGRYALGVLWGDRHDSILPFRNLRRACPCETCTAAPEVLDLPPEAERLARVEVLGDRSLFLGWGDG